MCLIDNDSLSLALTWQMLKGPTLEPVLDTILRVRVTQDAQQVRPSAGEICLIEEQTS